MTFSTPIVISSSSEDAADQVVTIKKFNKRKNSKVFVYFSQMVLQKEDLNDLTKTVDQKNMCVCLILSLR